jgi:hypothetical protein
MTMTFMAITFEALTFISGIVTAIGDGGSALYHMLASANSPVTDKVADKVAEIAGVDSSVLSQHFEGLKAYIIENFGESGLYASYIAVAAISVFVLSKLFKISFSILKLVVVPSVALAFLAAFFLPQNFFHFLPVTVSLFSVLLLFRG